MPAISLDEQAREMLESYGWPGNIRQLNIFNKKDGSFVDRIKADKLFDGQNDVQMMPYEGNQVLVLVKDSSKKDTDGDKVFMLKL